MKLTKLMKGSALGALAAAMAITALPAEAVAQSRGPAGTRRSRRPW